MSVNNWAANVSVEPENHVAPRTFNELYGHIVDANGLNKRVHALGSAWSFTDVWATDDVLIDTKGLNAVLALSQGRRVWGQASEGSQVLTEALKDSVLDNEDIRLIHVEAGITIKDLYMALDDTSRDRPSGRSRWALGTQGGSSGQTLAGVISTGTHGGDFNEPPIADWVQAIHIVGPDGFPRWIERSEPSNITDLDRLARFGDLGLLAGMPKREHIYYDTELFNAALVSLGMMGVIYSVVLKVREQYGISEVVHSDTTWNTVKEWLRGDIFSGTAGLDWMSRHPANLATGAPARAVPRGVGIFINPYRISDDYASDPNPDRKAVVVTHAASTSGFDVPHVRPSGGNALHNFFRGLFAVNLFEMTGSVSVVRSIIDGVIGGLRSSTGTTGYPVAYSVLDTTSNDKPPVLSMEIVVSTADNNHIRLIDRLLERFDEIHRNNWSSGWKFAGGLNLRFTAPSDSLLGMQSRMLSASPGERFCHIEIVTLKELPSGAPYNMENYTEGWVKMFEDLAVESGARLHWGQLNRLNRVRVERGYSDKLHRWRRARTLLADGGNSKMLSNSASMRYGLEAYDEVLTATSWGPGRYDVFGLNAKGEVYQLWWNSGWHWSNLENRFPGGERFVGPLAATSWGPNRLDIFGLGRENNVLQLFWDGAWRWIDLEVDATNIFRRGRGLVGPLASASPAAGRIELFCLLAGGDIGRYWYDSAGWHYEQLRNRFSGGDRFHGSITAVSDSPSSIHVFGMGRNGQVLQLWRNGGETAPWNWSDLSSAFPPERVHIAGPLTAISSAPNCIDLYARGEFGTVWRLGWRSGWSSEELTGQFPTTVSRYGMHHEFGFDPNLENIYRFELVNTNERFAGPLTAASWGGRRVDVFGLGDAGDVLQLWRADDSHAFNWSSLGNHWA